MRPELLVNRRGLRLRTRRLRAGGIALALVVGVTLSAVAASAAAGTGPGGGHAALPATGNAALPGAPGGAAPAAEPQAPQTTAVTLPTGDQVRLTTAGGSQQATPVPAGTVHGTLRQTATFVRFSWDGDQYVVPDAAVPYLGSTFDPRLFDVSYLARAHLGTPGSAGIPAQITYTSSTQTASVPGLHVTSRSGATASGTITTSGASRLGQLLATQWHAARNRHSFAPAGRLPGLERISLVSPAGAQALPAAPGRIPARTDAAARGLPFYTLTLNATDLDGNPGTFAGIVQNVNNLALFDQQASPLVSAATGTESLSVPKGTYSLAISIKTPDPSGTGFSTALVVKPQVTVNANTTVSLDARTAVPYRATPSPAVSAAVRTDTLGMWRSSTAGGLTSDDGQFIFGLYSVSPNPLPTGLAGSLLATPTVPVSEGSFFFDADTAFTNSSSDPGPMYVLDFPHPGTIPSSLTYTVPASALTTVHSDLYQTPLTPGCAASAVDSSVYWPVGNGIWSSQEFQSSAVAGERTDYWYSSDPGLGLWQYTTYYSGSSCSVGRNGPVWSIHPGQQITATWNKAPLAPSSLAPPYWGAGAFVSQGAIEDGLLGKSLGDPRLLAACTACRQGDIATVNIMPYGDSGPAQYENDLQIRSDQGDSAFSFYRNGTLAIDTAPYGNFSMPLGWELPLLPRPATYQLDWTQAGQPGETPSGASTETDWTFRSGPDGRPSSLPPTETCAPDASRPCSWLPLLFPSYNLPLNTSNQATAGTTEPINFTVTAQQNAPLPRLLSATVSVSFDGGQTWSTAQDATSLGGGQFTTMITQPALSATNGFVSLRVTAKDAFGDSVIQTITDAYGLTS
jgi:hypothetical protein